MDKELVGKVLVLLHEKNHTVYELAKNLNVDDEIEILKVIVYLEVQNQITLKGFKTVYREDGGCIHLEIYGIY